MCDVRRVEHGAPCDSHADGVRAGARGKAKPRGLSFRMGVLCPVKCYCDACGRKRFPASLQESKESPWRRARCEEALE